MDGGDPVCDIGLDRLVGNFQRGGQLAEQKLLRLLEIALVHHAEAAVLGFCLTALGVNGHGELHQTAAVMLPETGLILLSQRLSGGSPTGSGMQSGNFTDKIFRLLPGDNGPHGHLVIVYRGVDQTALIDGFKLIVKPLLTGAAHPLLPPVNGKHPTDAGGAIDQQISCLKHGKCLLSKNCKDFRFITILTLFWQKCQRIYEKSKKSLFF